jgi:hypothetical protein
MIYALIRDGACYNVIVADPKFCEEWLPEDVLAVECSGDIKQPEPGWAWDGKSFVAPKAIAVEEIGDA